MSVSRRGDYGDLKFDPDLYHVGSLADVKTLCERDYEQHMDNKTQFQDKVENFELTPIGDEQLKALQAFKCDLVMMLER